MVAYHSFLEGKGNPVKTQRNKTDKKKTRKRIDVKKRKSKERV